MGEKKIATLIGKEKGEKKGFFVDCSISLLEGVIGDRIGGTISPVSYACRYKKKKQGGNTNISPAYTSLTHYGPQWTFMSEVASIWTFSSIFLFHWKYFV